MWVKRPAMALAEGDDGNQTETTFAASKQETALSLLVSELGRYTLRRSQPMNATEVSYDPRKQRAVPR
jgi:hypothetical protein